MAETKQISATIDLELANEVTIMAGKENRSFSQMVEILLRDALTLSSLNKSKNKKKVQNG